MSHMPHVLPMIWMILCVHLTCITSQPETDFIYNGFNQADLYTDGVAKVLPEGQLQLTNGSGQSMGHAFIKKPFEFTSPESLSFSTHFVCALVPKPGSGGHGIAFVLSASMDLSHADATQYLGLFNISNQVNSSHLVAVELDTALSAEFNDKDANHVGINVNNLTSIESAPAAYFSDTKRKNETIELSSGDPIQVWVDYRGNVLNVSMAPLKNQKPSQPLLSTSLNLSEIFPDRMIFIGFSGATGTLISYQYILGWSFSGNGASLHPLDATKLPRVPPHKCRTERRRPSTLLIFLLALLAVIVLAVLVAAFIYRRRKYAEVREEWEEEYGPHRFSYKTLYDATRGFHEDGLLGKGGFGEVYKGTLPCDARIAVKRVTHRDADEGMKQFVAEIVSLGNLKHKNIVPLLGYCRRKGELLLLSEYMPNGSLDQYLFHDDKPPLSWPGRVKIIKDVASALGYMHAGAPQVVLHRDIKASNVMLDAEFNARLGDFGMARFHDDWADTTAAVGTIGYMAPELTTTRASTATDVYSFGAFLLEVTCGRRPVDPSLPEERRYLVKWVCQCWETDSLFGARDVRMRGEISSEEVEMVMKVGLLCTNALAKMRPSMEEVVRYLNESLKLPDISLDTPGIGSFVPLVIGSTNTFSTFSYSSSYSGNDSRFVTHSIVHGHGR